MSLPCSLAPIAPGPLRLSPPQSLISFVTVIDDFIARSSDELSLAKGDRVELIERDDEFGDGWFLGRHLVNGNNGLFPEGASPFPIVNVFRLNVLW